MRLRIRSLIGLIVLLVLTGAMAMAQNGSVFTCSSNNGQLHSCRVNTDQPIQFVRQRSNAQCIEGQTYGINRGGVWVTNGCQADFAVGNTNQAYHNNGYYNRQGADNGGYYNQGNGSYNDHDRNAGYRDQNGVWHPYRHHGDRDNDHDHGTYSQNGQYNGPYNNGQYGQRGAYNGNYSNGGYVGQGPQHPTVYYGKYSDGKTTCSAQPGTGPVYCQTNGALSDATIINQNGSCRRGQNWDINPDGLWVADGCSAQFRIQR